MWKVAWVSEFLRPELLAPAGDWDSLRAAVASGADAVYFGLPEFNARHRAQNFAGDELPEVLDFLHEHNTRGYVTLNTLIFSDELPAVTEAIRRISEAGVDAVIVQDVGLVRLIRRVAPELPVHASTQMTLTEPLAIERVRRWGVERVILARELSVADVATIRQATTMPLEVFIHGALCVAYSGQCLTSEAIGGRSANRGQCAQACRLPYDLFVDGKYRDLGDQAYLVSPQDLAGYDQVADLAPLVASLKIEGRLKGPAYVAVTTQTYRKAIDAAVSGTALQLERQDEIDLAQSFSRGLTPGFLAGLDHQRLVAGRSPKKRGVRIGWYHGRTAEGVLVRLAEEHADADWLKAGDGIVFDQGQPQSEEDGGRIYRLRPVAHPTYNLVEIVLAGLPPHLDTFNSDTIVWRTDDPTLLKRLESHYPARGPVHRLAVRARLSGQIGGELTLAFTSADGHTVESTWPGPLAEARTRPVDPALVEEQLGRLGETPFVLDGLEIDVDTQAMLPKSVLNDLRRQATEQLIERRRDALRLRPTNVHALAELRREVPRSEKQDARPTQMSVLVRSLEQLEAVLAWRPDAPVLAPERIDCDFEDTRRYRDAVARCREVGARVGLATLRILKPGEEGWLRQIAKLEPDAVLIRNLGSLAYFQEHLPNTQFIGDHSLNVANELAAAVLWDEGLERLTPGFDLNFDQLAAMLRHSDPGRFEVVVHHHMPMFHMEHCVFAHTLSNGKDHRDCGRPCDHHQVELRDRSGNRFPLLPDTGCRNTLYNALPQSAAEYIPRLIALGIRQTRIEFLREPADQVVPLLTRYGRVLAGIDDGRTTWRGLQVLGQVGLTRGTLQLS